MNLPEIDLYFKEGSSDKVYQARVEPNKTGFDVAFSYGRRGNTLQTGRKATNVSYQKAVEVYTKLVNEKMAKGYTPDETGTPYVATPKSGQISGYYPQLLNEIEEDDIQGYIQSDDWVFQQKFDGKRIMIKREGSDIYVINRKGLYVGAPETFMTSARSLQDDFLIDGEAIGDYFYAFDCLEHAGEDLRTKPYLERHTTLTQLLKSGQSIHLIPSLLVRGAKNKEAFITELLASGAEGFVLKRAESPYCAGRPNSGGDQLKYKFYNTASVQVEAVNTKRSVQMAIVDTNGSMLSIGNVTIPPNYPIPTVGDIVEVRYLYAYQGGSLYQPTYLGKREDIDLSECTVDQLKYKAAHVTIEKVAP